MNRFKIIHKNEKARVGKLTTAHGVIETPNFIPVGTQASVKALSPKDLKEIGVQVVLANTYHLMLRPGDGLIKKLGGLHKFMGWDGVAMTDSGGFQVFSLGVALEHGVGKLLREQVFDSEVAQTRGVTGYSEQSKPRLNEQSSLSSDIRPRLNKITEGGVTFQSHLDGSRHILTPEKSMQIQANLGADLTVAFDDLESPKYSYEETLKSLELTERWELRSKKAYYRENSLRTQATPGWLEPLLYGVTHGGVFQDLRIRSAKFVDKHFAGIALGGAHKDRKTLYQVVEWTVANVSDEKPRHLLGIGEPVDIIECIERGVDLFDCAAPTRRARNGSLYISPPFGSIKNNFTRSIGLSEFTNDPKPWDLACHCYSCQNFSRAYLRHLYMTKELLYYQLSSYHNVYFINNLMEEAREALGTGQFRRLKNKWMGTKS